MKRPIRFAALILGLSVAMTASAQIYQWKDKDGRTHFSDMPPPNQPGVQMKTPRQTLPAVVVEPEPDETEATEGNTKPKDAAAPAQEKSQAEQRDEEFRKRRAAAAGAKEKAEKDAARKAQREQGCQRARAQLAALKSGQRFAVATEDGGRRILDDGERAAEIARAEEQVRTLCEGN